MKKNILALTTSLVIATAANANYDTKNGWTLLGVGDTQTTISSHNLPEFVDVAWKYSDGKWQAFTRDQKLKQTLEEYSISIFDNINSGEGFWVRGSAGTIETNNKTEDQIIQAIKDNPEEYDLAKKGSSNGLSDEAKIVVSPLAKELDVKSDEFIDYTYNYSKAGGVNILDKVEWEEAEDLSFEDVENNNSLNRTLAKPITPVLCSTSSSVCLKLKVSCKESITVAVTPYNSLATTPNMTRMSMDGYLTVVGPSSDLAVLNSQKQRLTQDEINNLCTVSGSLIYDPVFGEEIDTEIPYRAYMVDGFDKTNQSQITWNKKDNKFVSNDFITKLEPFLIAKPGDFIKRLKAVKLNKIDMFDIYNNNSGISNQSQLISSKSKNILVEQYNYPSSGIKLYDFTNKLEPKLIKDFTNFDISGLKVKISDDDNVLAIYYIQDIDDSSNNYKQSLTIKFFDISDIYNISEISTSTIYTSEVYSGEEKEGDVFNSFGTLDINFNNDSTKLSILNHGSQDIYGNELWIVDVSNGDILANNEFYNKAKSHNNIDFNYGALYDNINFDDIATDNICEISRFTEYTADSLGITHSSADSINVKNPTLSAIPSDMMDIEYIGKSDLDINDKWKHQYKCILKNKFGSVLLIATGESTYKDQATVTHKSVIQGPLNGQDGLEEDVTINQNIYIKPHYYYKTINSMEIIDGDDNIDIIKGDDGSFKISGNKVGKTRLLVNATTQKDNILSGEVTIYVRDTNYNESVENFDFTSKYNYKKSEDYEFSSNKDNTPSKILFAKDTNNYYAASGFNGVEVYNGNKKLYSSTGTKNAPRYISDIEISTDGNWLYAAGEIDGLFVYSLEDKDKPKLEHIYKDIKFVSHISIAKDKPLAYISNVFGYLTSDIAYLVDLTIPSDIKILYTIYDDSSVDNGYPEYTELSPDGKYLATELLGQIVEIK